MFKNEEYQITFIVQYNTNFGQELLISGSIDELTQWKSSKKMNWTDQNFWEYTLILTNPCSFEYKYLLSENNNNNFETRPNRIFLPKLLENRNNLILHDIWENRTIYELNYNNMPFLLSLPPLKFENESVPLIVFLHGSGESFIPLKSLMYIDYDCGPLTNAIRNSNFNFAVTVPHCSPYMSWLTNYMPNLEQMTENLIKEFNFNKKQIFLTGFSMGGGVSFELYCMRTDLFSACAILCGFKPTNSNLYKKLNNNPLMIFHGLKNEILPFHDSLEIYDLLKEKGEDPILKLLPDFGHNIWYEIYSKNEIYDFFYKNVKK